MKIVSFHIGCYVSLYGFVVFQGFPHFTKVLSIGQSWIGSWMSVDSNVNSDDIVEGGSDRIKSGFRGCEKTCALKIAGVHPNKYTLVLRPSAAGTWDTITASHKCFSFE
jgi:hypothetical protein